jgi:general secretion pathway protein H
MAKPAVRAKMPTLAAGSPKGLRRCPGAHSGLGFTLIELLVVVAIMAIASAGVVLTLRDNTASKLERDAQRLAAMLESGRAQSRMQGTPVLWRAVPGGFVMEGASPQLPAQSWLSTDTTVAAVLHPAVPGMGNAPTLTLGPDPLIEPQTLVLSLRSQPAVRVQIATDGLRPFALLPIDAPAGAPSP